uniref:(northern house mosquito) hypothetical protein n=1 Tax=Culex pipiens TaxID=7175 RepID=A0A8D8P0E1_CULPI
MVRYQSQGKSGSVPDHQPAAFPTSQCHDQGSKCGHRWGYGFAGEIHRPHHPRGRQLQRSHHAGRNLRTDPADRQRGKRVRRYPLHQRKVIVRQSSVCDMIPTTKHTTLHTHTVT